MSKIIHLSIFLILIAFLQCTDTNKNPILILTKTAIGTGENQVVTDTLKEINSDYFEVGLYKLADSEEFIAQREIEQAKSIDNFKFVFFNIVDEEKNVIRFKTSTEFLNYMSDHGYEMVDQVKKNTDVSYTFKRK